MTEMIIELIALDNQLISVVEDQGFLCHLEFLNPRYALPSRHYITLTGTFELHCASMRTRLTGLTAEHVKQAIK